MSARPAAADLLEEARRTLLETLLPLLPAEHRYDGLMVANAMAIAARDARMGDQLLRAEVKELAALLDAPLPEGAAPPELRAEHLDWERRVAQDIRSGAYEAAGLRRDALRRYLRASTEARLRLTNPKALAPR
jgi:hypothetical protein